MAFALELVKPLGPGAAPVFQILVTSAWEGACDLFVGEAQSVREAACQEGLGKAGWGSRAPFCALSEEGLEAEFDFGICRKDAGALG